MDFISSDHHPSKKRRKVANDKSTDCFVHACVCACVFKNIVLYKNTEKAKTSSPYQRSPTVGLLWSNELISARAVSLT